MYKITNIKLPIGHKEEELTIAVLRKLKIEKSGLVDCKISKKAIDCRERGNIQFVYTVVATTKKGAPVSVGGDVASYDEIPYKYLMAKAKDRPVVVGLGPAGLFASYILAKAGLNPIVIEQGLDIDARSRVIGDFEAGGSLNTKTNIQFGEGGAGAFSDGKLNTGIKDLRCNFVLEKLHEFGASQEILYTAKPHVGTDKLKAVVKNMRSEIIQLGGEIRFETELKELLYHKEQLCEIKVLSKGKEEILLCSKLVLCIGHSSRKTFEMLHKSGVPMEQKEFSLGVRIEHLQNKIDLAQYKDTTSRAHLGAADYKLFTHLKNGRTLYTFCMCPGGEVVCGSSEEGGIVTNGMSEFSRNKTNSNSALLVSISKQDFASSNPLAGVEFQRKWERLCYGISNSYKAPCVKVGDFLKNRTSKSFGDVKPSYKIGTVFGDFRECLPKYVIDSMREGILLLDNKMRGFASSDALMTGVETRSSSPVRILRNDNFESEKKGLYPCGEGAGYSGGIMSSAVDGIKCAEAVISKLIKI